MEPPNRTASGSVSHPREPRLAGCPRSTLALRASTHTSTEVRAPRLPMLLPLLVILREAVCRFCVKHSRERKSVIITIVTHHLARGLLLLGGDDTAP